MEGVYSCSDVPLGDAGMSVGALVRDRASRFGARTAFRERDPAGTWRELSFSGLDDAVRDLGAAFLATGLRKGDRVATCTPNCAEMLVWELAAMSIGALCVPIFARYGPDQVGYHLAHSGARLVLVADDAGLARVLGAPVSPHLEGIVRARGMGEGSGGDSRIRSREALLGEISAGADAAFEAASRQVGPDDPCLIMYTSGTTGLPKGVVLTHGNILSQQRGLSRLWDIGPDDRFLSYLPWHHSFGGLFERFTALSAGAALCLDDSGGRDIGRLLANWREIRPTVFFSVPKVHAALATEARLSSDVDRLIGSGGLRLAFTAAAPLPPGAAAYFEQRGIPVLEGWGLTETSPCVTLTPPGEERISGVVGRPLPGVEILVREDGEICVRGPNVMRGYWRDPDRTAAAIDSYGWFRTGDLGELGPRGLRIICRADGVFKLSNGEKVASALVEGALLAESRYIEQAVVVGAGREYLGALLFPNFRNLAAWATERLESAPRGPELLAFPDVRDLITGEVRRANAGIAVPYQRVRACALLPRELAIEAGELTPSLKVARTVVLERFGPIVEALYRPDGSGDGSGAVVVRLEETVP